MSPEAQARAELLNWQRSRPDLDDGPRLERIEQYSTWLISDAETVRRNVRVLTGRPDFETRAVANMQLAKTRLEAALKDINEALAAYEQPVTA